MHLLTNMRKLAGPFPATASLFHHGGCSLRQGVRLLDFSVNINPLGPPPSVLETLRRELPAIAHYPDPEGRPLARRLLIV